MLDGEFKNKVSASSSTGGLDKDSGFCLHAHAPLRAMPIIEICLIIFLALWVLGNGLYSLRWVRLYQFLSRVNGCLLFVRWGVFSNRDPARRAGTFELLFRERLPNEAVGEWRCAAVGHCWSWSAWLWLPERYRAAAIQNLGRQIKTRFSQARVDPQTVSEYIRVLETVAADLCPTTNGAQRDFRLVRRFPSGAGDDEEVLTFTRSHYHPHALGK